MSLPSPPLPAKLVIGALTRHRSLIPQVYEQMKALFGTLDLVSPWYRFEWTRYYEPEMGTGLVRRLAAFGPLIEQEQLASIKEQTNGIERQYTESGKRLLNIDPGYLLAERFVLATGKNHAHRIYIGRQMYADLTLLYRKGDYQALEWTYPDYAHEDIRDFLKKTRNKYMRDLKTERLL
jgi:hypothetical protein